MHATAIPKTNGNLSKEERAKLSLKLLEFSKQLNGFDKWSEASYAGANKMAHIRAKAYDADLKQNYFSKYKDLDVKKETDLYFDRLIWKDAAKGLVVGTLSLIIATATSGTAQAISYAVSVGSAAYILARTFMHQLNSARANWAHGSYPKFLKENEKAPKQ